MAAWSASSAARPRAKLRDDEALTRLSDSSRELRTVCSELRARAEAAEAQAQAARALHKPETVATSAVLEDGNTWRDIEPDSFEGITSRKTICVTCWGGPEWPCATATALGMTEDR